MLLRKNKYILIGGTKTELEQSFIQLLCGDHEVAVVTVETPLEESNNKPSGIELLFDRQPWSQLNLCSSCSKSSQMPATEVFVRRVIFAYLTLLVNSRNEIALARCLNIPDRELDHLAFTALKKMAKEKNMPMFQTAISFVMKIRIKCAITDDPLSPYVKGMNEFVNMIQKLQIIIEEDPDTSSSLRRVLNVIKNTICKSNDVKLRKSSVEAVTRKLHDEIDQLIVTNKNANSKQSPQVSVSNGGSIAGRQSIKLLRLLLDHECCQDIGNNSVSVLSDCYSSQKTPIRFPSLLSQFRSPDQCSPDEPENQTLIERVSLKVNKPQSSFQQISHQSCMAWADEDMLKKPALDPLMIYQDAPLSATHDVTSDVTANNIKNTKESFLIVKKQKDLKKRILEEIGDDEIEIEEPPVENAKKKSKKNKEVKTNIVKESKSKKTSSVTRNRKKAMPLQKGQKQMTQFFRL
uniref:PCNA-interacting partner n=1 Tax=Saccoglossus kowalevskii TaxID=10224 RepID=A0ABM0GI65_SACKO|nr:PREDICTED: PCNA-interacting partner-like [Saccoglossus kowalevskii]